MSRRVRLPVIVTLTTSVGEARDTHAAGCIVSDELRGTHPYPRLRATLQRLALVHFGQGLYDE
jgi:hypothetical protein